MKSFIVLIFIQICISLRKAFNINKALNYYRQYPEFNTKFTQEQIKKVRGY